MKRLLTKRQVGEMGWRLKVTVFQLLVLPLLMLIALSALFGTVGWLVGSPWAVIVLDFFGEVTVPVLLFQATLLMLAGAIAALFFGVGTYRLDILASYVADKLRSKIKGLTLFWSAMLAGVRTPFPSPTAPVLRAHRWACSGVSAARFVPGHSPQFE